ncbi:MAG TPA: hypothetical protein ENN34_10335 [Deltaproteobacteria bacterium]|nr:hypothetical protein [Deltaproteobacteria bacterium]
MDRIVLGAGIVGVVGGFCILVYQTLMFLMHGTWPAYSLQTAVDNGPNVIAQAIGSSPVIAGFTQGCPLFVAVIVIGLVLLFFGSKLRNRYS